MPQGKTDKHCNGRARLRACRIVQKVYLDRIHARFAMCLLEMVRLWCWGCAPYTQAGSNVATLCNGCPTARTVQVIVPHIRVAAAHLLEMMWHKPAGFLLQAAHLLEARSTWVPVWKLPKQVMKSGPCPHIPSRVSAALPHNVCCTSKAAIAGQKSRVVEKGCQGRWRGCD